MPLVSHEVAVTGLNPASGLLLITVVTKTRSSQTIGLECATPGMPVFQAMLVPLATSHAAGSLFSYAWQSATPGAHTLVSRVTDITGKIQPTGEDLAANKTFLQDNSQFLRKLMIS